MFNAMQTGRAGLGLATARAHASQRALDRGRIFKSLGALGAEDSRPSIDYVRAGDVIRVYVAYDPGAYFSSTAIGARFTQNLTAAFNVVQAPASADAGIFGTVRAWIVDVQPRSDYAHLNDVKSVVLSAAQNAGLNVNVGASYAQFVSKVEAVGTTPPVSIPSPGGTASAGAGTGDAISNFFSNLTQSPTTLAVILVAALGLFVAARGR